MPDLISWDEPGLRPSKYKTKELVDRDPETFYHDEGIIKAQTKRRNRFIQKRPHAYANGWNCGPAYEISTAPDSAFYDWAQTDLAISKLGNLKNKKEPFSLAVGYYRPHLPFVVPERYWKLYNRDRLKNFRFSLKKAGNLPGRIGGNENMPFLRNSSPLLKLQPEGHNMSCLRQITGLMKILCKMMNIYQQRLSHRDNIL